VVDGTEGFARCAVGLAECSDETPCPLHDSWKPLRTQINDYLQGISVADLATALSRKRQILQKRTASRASAER
jgi:DNA-binding IscR family transcriptional regulator